MSFDHVDRVVFDAARQEMVVDWETPAERARRASNPLIRGALRALIGVGERLDQSPTAPTRVRLDAETFARVRRALATVRERVGYDFELVDADTD